MKKNALLIPMLSLAMLGSAGKMYGNPVVISGKWERAKPRAVSLYRLENGDLKELAISEVTADSTFYFAHKPQQEGFYFIGESPRPLNRYTFYLKPQDAALRFTVAPRSYALIGNNTPENQALEQWHAFVQPLEWKSVYFMKEISTYVDFFPLLEEKLAQLATYPKSATGNTLFDAAFEEYKRFNLLDLAVTFLYAPRTAHPEGEDFPEYYRDLDLPSLTKTTAILRYVPSGVDLIGKILFCKLQLSGKKIDNPVSAILDSIDQVANDTLRGELVLSFAAAQKTYAGLCDYESKYGKQLATEAQKNQMRTLKNSLNVVKDSEPAIDFRFPDETGKPVALSDFRGKLVYVDVWATWCGPCKKELPHLKKLEEEFRDNPNIVFLSVATDPAKDKEKWLRYIKANEMKGVQLFAGASAKKDLMDPYKIAGIPRFILVGKDGRLLTTDAPRPSSPEIRPLLNEHLK
ncbi:MAG: TlpA family protein disulfide reductase [Prevotellaceae bacterium]|jgi:thiol-disulfide isomerase/thioredoxin|nr:TlpA family protein disulfide reductase [Prevotellaceae bacterium]